MSVNSRRNIAVKTTLRILTVAVIAFVIYLLVPFENERLSRDYSQVILAKDSSFMRVFLNGEQQWLLPPVLQPDIPENLKSAVLTFEDQYFYKHFGVNPVALVRATYLNAKHGKIVSGGSTISMQLARMIRKKPRTFWNKFRETLLAVKLEAHLSKEEILKEYLTHAPYGSNIRGNLAASYRFFGKKPNQLTWGEAALLAVLPNAPGVIFPTSNQDILTKKRNGLLEKLLVNELIDKETYELSLLEKIPSTIIPFPLHAPHLTERIHAENQLNVVYTTIDAEIQSDVNFFAKQHASQLSQLGIRNVSTLIVDNTSGEVVGYVGSHDYHDLDRNGRVDGVQAARSSGSILKPFLYALSIDDGHILPQTLIKDVPTYFSSFSPNNASEKFSGVSLAKEALIHSLNIPAVRLLNTYGLEKFYNQLKAAGVSSLFRNADEYGLPLILGGAEVTPWDMARLYSGFSNGGVFSDISYLKNQPKGYQTKLVSSGAAHLILDEMKELLRPGLEFYWKKYSSQKPIAWKTGTSYGHKDAWAVGSTPKWTVVVWAGNFDGESNNSLTGMRSAGPLLFNIFNALPEDGEVWYEADPSDFVQVNICASTGFYASLNCPNTEEVNAPVNMKPLGICPYHQRYFAEEHTGGTYSVCSHCWSGDQQLTHQLKFTPDINFYLRKNGNLVETEPTHNPICATRQEQGILQIIYPLHNANIFVPKDFDGQRQSLVGKVASQFPNRELFWYLDDELLGSTVKRPSFPLQLDGGRHTLTVVDTEGNKDQVRFSAILN